MDSQRFYSLTHKQENSTAVADSHVYSAAATPSYPDLARGAARSRIVTASAASASKCPRLAATAITIAT